MPRTNALALAPAHLLQQADAHAVGHRCHHLIWNQPWDGCTGRTTNKGGLTRDGSQGTGLSSTRWPAAFSEQDARAACQNHEHSDYLPSLTVCLPEGRSAAASAAARRAISAAVLPNVSYSWVVCKCKQGEFVI